MNLRERARELAWDVSCKMKGDEPANAKVIEAAIRQGMRYALAEPDEVMVNVGEDVHYNGYWNKDLDAYAVWTAMARKRLEGIE